MVARLYVKYHWLPVAGMEDISRQESAARAGMNPDIAGQDLYDPIAAGSTYLRVVISVMLGQERTCDTAKATNLSFY